MRQRSRGLSRKRGEVTGWIVARTRGLSRCAVHGKRQTMRAALVLSAKAWLHNQETWMTSTPWRKHVRWMAALLVAFAATTGAAQAQTRTAFVHLFEWKWTDVARECETFLGPKGFAAVQISPPQEHNWVTAGDGAPFPWWMRYQPVGYSLDKSRGGTRAEFANMVSRCNAVGVAVYADAVINHMSGGNSGTSSAGNAWSAKNYPRVPYGVNDFHASCGINNYNDAGNVQYCELSGLQDLNTGAAYVQGKIVDYLADMANLGVKGFRIDAAKHMAPSELSAIVNAVNARVASPPFWFLEVIGAPGEAVQPSQYFSINNNQATVTEFAYGPKLWEKFAGGGKLADLRTFGESWGLMGSSKAIAFVDNHDKQRGHGGGGNFITYHYGGVYDAANVFMLAWPYGYPGVMSSYAFKKDTNYDTSFGPPYNTADGSTRGPWDGQATAPRCFGQAVGDWVCEHRFRPIANMIGFRNATVGSWSVNNWWDNGNNQIAFSRGDKGFVAINREAAPLVRQFQTGLGAGRYCDVMSGDFSAGACSGNTITVDTAGYANLTVPAYGHVALHVDAKVSSANTATSNITLRVENADPAAGQTVVVAGNQAALGNWDACKGVPLAVNGTGHQAVVSVPAGAAVQYKFVKRNAACTTTAWEGVANRAVTAPSSGGSTVCGVWNSTAACGTTVGTVNVTFNEVAQTQPGQNVYVVGNRSELGAWNAAAVKPLTWISGTGSTGHWRATLALPANVTVEYKYIRKAGNGDVVWESGANRVLNTAGVGAGQSTNDTWK
jgi:alpha-amylase